MGHSPWCHTHALFYSMVLRFYRLLGSNANTGHAECSSSTILFPVEPGNAVFSVSNRASQLTLVVKNLPANAGDIRDSGSIPGLGRCPGGGHGNPLQYSCLENPHGQRRLAGYSPEGHKELDTTEVM